MKPIIIQTEAKVELAEGMAWYDEQVPGLSLDFLAEVERAIQRLRQNPQWCPPHKFGFRKQCVRRFPYRIYFMDQADMIWVAAVAHTSRKPDYWTTRKLNET
ncbi:MAG: type II toxin-antitoxin system RelE/ParE family toxin [Verrucomicrobia bacterium]|nr:type II toxin-antitoxin system RelE/ParE family toxin [Verrucomicrobiota bacterium]